MSSALSGTETDAPTPPTPHTHLLHQRVGALQRLGAGLRRPRLAVHEPAQVEAGAADDDGDLAAL